MHSEGESPFVVRKDHDTSNEEQDTKSVSSGSVEADDLAASDQYVQCPEEGCGEALLRSDLQNHLDFHVAANIAIGSTDIDVDEQRPPAEKTKTSPNSHKQQHSKKSTRGLRDKTESTSLYRSLRRSHYKLHDALFGLIETGRKDNSSSSSVRRRLGVRGNTIDVVQLLT